MKILLVQPFKDTSLGRQSYPPIGLGYLASNVRHLGDVKILDCLRENKDYIDFISSIRYYSPDVVGINVFSISAPHINEMIHIIKRLKPKCKVVLGGPHISALPERVFTDFPKADFAIRGEGEIPFKNIIESNFNAPRINEPYFAKNIEDYGYPMWHLIKPREYFKYLNIGKDSTPIFFSRGCPYPCTFCAAKVVSGQQLRRRSWEHIYPELNYLQEAFGIKRFIIEDEGFGTNKEGIMYFSKMIKESNFKAKFMMGVGMRLDIIDEELLSSMEEAGFEKTIALGIESGSQRILDLMRKKTTLKLIKDKVNLMDKCGFQPTGYFMLGYPTETKEEMEETVKLSLSLPLREAGFTAFQPLPSTEATRYLMLKGELPQDFDFTTGTPNKIIYAPEGTTLEELEDIRKNAILRFWLRPRQIIRCFNLFALIKLFTIFFRKNR